MRLRERGSSGSPDKPPSDIGECGIEATDRRDLSPIDVPDVRFFLRTRKGHS